MLAYSVAWVFGALKFSEADHTSGFIRLSRLLRLSVIKREYTQKELRRHNGEYGEPGWMPMEGEVSNSFLSRTRKHPALHYVIVISASLVNFILYSPIL